MDARFAIAARHSRMVRVLRVAVPAAVILAMAAVVAVSIFNPFRMLLPKLPLDMGNLVVSGTKITMESPHLSGYTPDQRPYEVWAKTATQDVTDPDHVDLKTLRAKVLMEDRTTVTLEEHVDVKLLNGTLTSDKLRITGGGEVVRFEGNVVMNLDNLGESGQPADASATPEEPVQPAKTRSIGKSANPK